MQIVDINGTPRNCLRCYADPSYPGYMRVEFKSHHEWFTIKEFISFNPTLTHLTSGSVALPPEDLGVVTSAKTDSLTDSHKKWEVNDYLGFTLWISRGKGEAQTRTVVKNSPNTIYIDRPWETKPDKTSQYVLTHETIHDSVVHGNQLPTV